MEGPRDPASTELRKQRDRHVVTIALMACLFFFFLVVGLIHYRDGKFPVSGGYAYLATEPRRFYTALALTAGIALFAVARIVWAALALRNLPECEEDQKQ